MVHEDYKELLSARALTTLDAEDTRALEIHLQTCAGCSAELIEWEQIAAFMAHDASTLEPSLEVRQRILKTIRTTTVASETSQSPTNLVESSVTRVESKILTFERHPRTVSSVSGIGAIAAALALIALLATIFSLWQQNRTTQTLLAKQNTQLDETNAQLARQREALTLLTSPGARMASLSGTNIAPTAQAMLAYDKKGHAMLMAKGLPAVPNGMAYQLWFIKDGKKMPGRVFTPDSAGNGMLEDDIPDVALEAAVFAITLEPKSGVQAPTGSIYLVSAT